MHIDFIGSIFCRYEHIPPEQQRKLHLELGTFLGSKTSLDNNVTIDISFEQLYLSDKHSTDDPILLPSSLVAVATEQINKVCPEFIQDREKFARWNLEAGKLSLESSNFRVASYFFDKGIAFLGEGLWSKDAHTLSLQLNEGRANTLYALGQATDAGKCASSIIEKVPFEDSLNAQLLLIRSFDCNGDNDRAISKAIEVLRELGVIDFPSDPSPATFKNAIIKTIQEASRYDYDEIPHLHQDRICEKSRIILKIMDAVTIACFRRGTRYLPLLASAMVSFSLNHGVCKESASAFAVFGYFSIYVLSDFEEARRHGNITLKILERTHTQRFVHKILC